LKLPLVHNFLAIAMAAAIGGVAVALIKRGLPAPSHSYGPSPVGQRP
jgi:AAHS family benzoate transporter-like MFS transporter